MMYLGENPISLATSIPLFANIANIEAGNYTPSEDTLVYSVTFNHSLNRIPDFIYVYSEPISNNGENWEKEYMLQSNGSNYPDSEAVNQSYLFSTVRTRAGATTIGTLYGGVSKSDYADSNSFKMLVANSVKETLYFKANTTYHYMIGNFKEVTPNA